MAVVLTIGAGLLLRTFRDLLQENPGFNATQVVTANVNLPYPSDPRMDPYHTVAKQSAMYRELGRRLNALPRLVGVAVCLSGIAFAGKAGMSKEREMSVEQKQATIKEFNLKK